MPENFGDDHPGDLLIEVFGTFLGKRSERMTIRWREARPRSGDVSGEARVPRLLRFPTLAASQEPAPSLAEEAPAAESSSPRGESLGEAAETCHDLPLANAGWKERQVALSRLRSVTICGRGVTISSDLIAALIERGIQLSFLSGRGDPVASLHSPALGATVQTRRAQLAAYETPLGLELARTFVQGKLRTQRHNLLYFAKYLKQAHAERYEAILRKCDALSNLRRQVLGLPTTGNRSPNLRDRLMGFEGTGGRLYWEAVAVLLSGKIEFPGRATRGATDPVNAALNYGYGILYAQVFGAVVNAGLEPFAGFLHVDRPGKPSLVLDLVEEFRAPAVDRPILAWLNQGGVPQTDEHGLDSPAKRTIADRVLSRLNTPVPFTGKRFRLRMVIQMQARALAGTLRGERNYRPFASRW